MNGASDLPAAIGAIAAAAATGQITCEEAASLASVIEAWRQAEEPAIC